MWEQLAFREMWNVAVLVPGLRIKKKVGNKWVQKRKLELVETFRAWKPHMGVVGSSAKVPRCMISQEVGVKPSRYGFKRAAQPLRREKRGQIAHELGDVNIVDRMKRAELMSFTRKVLGVNVRQWAPNGKYMVYRLASDVRRDCKETQALLYAPFLHESALCAKLC